MTVTIVTAFSTYELDQQRRQVRRVTGRNSPCKFIGEDGVWRDYADWIASHDGGMWFWNTEGKGFCTSTVIRIIESPEEGTA